MNFDILFSASIGVRHMGTQGIECVDPVKVKVGFIVNSAT